jgi:hypothetical protein
MSAFLKSERPARVLDVPQDATAIGLGILINGTVHSRRTNNRNGRNLT